MTRQSSAERISRSYGYDPSMADMINFDQNPNRQSMVGPPQMMLARGSRPNSMAGPLMANPGMNRPASYVSNSPRHSVALAAPGGVSEDMLAQEIRRILAGANLMTVTKKQVRDELAMIFGMDMTPRKDFINAVIEQTIRGGM